MGHTYTVALFHVVFSTKQRAPEIPDIAKLAAYLRGVANNLQIKAVEIGGTSNHVHALIGLPSTMSIADAVQKLKSNSSRWLRESGAFSGWQTGYGAFSVSASNVSAVRAYIRDQEEHHRTRSFEDEFTALLEKSGVKAAAEVFD